ncbi:formate/nitrite transporter family protein [Xylanibacillus composti]|uniref:Formate transporter n=1 Tax=Xylanibacillus composti TaxID=1572762 RepID=A0A8J4H5B4_9BACL|nr:formate/nitrite transporter family protein [Xylanibacillus composti]MDT9726062.1 formate/nitrite transporter family protein [Xylanibacillus composti]GIQ68793.1 formate transporter [Xylanibacillus composti]
MDYVKPNQVLHNMIQTGAGKAQLPVIQLILRGFLGGAILAYATTLAFTATSQTGLGLVGALVFPLGFVIIILLGLELVTGSFALIPLAVMERRATAGQMANNFFWVIVGHVIGCLFYAGLYYASITKMGTVHDHALAVMIAGIAEGKTIAYKEMGAAGLGLVFIRAVLCNWMVTLGAVMAMTSQSTLGKIAAMWLPILAFFAQGFEHAVVNMFVIPAGMMFGAEVSAADWWLWNQIPVLVGNLAGGLILTGLFLYWSHAKKPGAKDESVSASFGARVGSEAKRA